MIMFSFSIFGAIFKPFGFGLVVFKWLMYVVTIIGKIFGSLTFAGASYQWIVAFSFLLVAFVMFMSDFTFFEKKQKTWLSAVSGVLALGCFVLAFVL